MAGFCEGDFLDAAEGGAGDGDADLAGEVGEVFRSYLPSWPDIAACVLEPVEGGDDEGDVFFGFR